MLSRAAGQKGAPGRQVVFKRRRLIWEFPKIRGTVLGVSIIGIVVFGGRYYGFPIFGKVPYCSSGFRLEGTGFWSQSLRCKV